MKKEKVYKILLYWLPVVLWMIVVFMFSSHPTKSTSEIYWQDFIVKKIAHIIEYGILATLLYRALLQSGVKKVNAGIYSVMFAFLYGLTDEYHQSFTPGREPRLRDVVFDTIGAILAIFVIWRLLPKAPKRLKNWAKSFQLI